MAYKQFFFLFTDVMNEYAIIIVASLLTTTRDAVLGTVGKVRVDFISPQGM